MAGSGDHYTWPVITRSAKRLANGSKNSTALRLLARVGFAVNGLLHVLIGLIAVQIATGSGGANADESGALAQLSASPGGVFILWTVVVGLVALGLWIAIGALLNREPSAGRRWAYRVAELGKSVAYFLVAATALTFALGSASGSGGGGGTVGGVLASPGGVVLLLAAGIGVFATGAYFIYKGATRKFTDDLQVPGGAAGIATLVLGVSGYAAKGVAIATVGVLMAVAAFTVDASKAEGLDGSLRALLGLPFGVVILCVVGAGLIAYGVYCFARARLARL